MIETASQTTDIKALNERIEKESAFIDEELGDTFEFGDDTRRGPHWFYSGASTFMADYAVRKRESNISSFRLR